VAKNSRLVTIGLRAKTGRAIIVVVGGTRDAPVVLYKGEIKLFDPKIPATFQPYHEVMELPWEQSQKAVQESARAIEAIARESLARLIAELRAGGMQVSGIGIIGTSDRDLSKIGNYHIRAHAAEGVLFRRVLDLAADTNKIKRRTFADRTLDTLMASELGRDHLSVKQKLTDLRRSVPAPWRTDEKQAAIAAWLVLHGSRK